MKVIDIQPVHREADIASSGSHLRFNGNQYSVKRNLLPKLTCVFVSNVSFLILVRLETFSLDSSMRIYTLNCSRTQNVFLEEVLCLLRDASTYKENRNYLHIHIQNIPRCLECTLTKRDFSFNKNFNSQVDLEWEQTQIRAHVSLIERLEICHT